MRSKTYCYWEKEQHHHVVILPTRKIAHLFSDIIVVYYTADIPKIVFNEKIGTKIPAKIPIIYN